MNNRVAEMRKQKRLSQSKLAKLAEISRPYLSAIERGNQQVISNVVMFKISNALQEPVSEVFFALPVVCTQPKQNNL